MMLCVSPHNALNTQSLSATHDAFFKPGSLFTHRCRAQEHSRSTVKHWTYMADNLKSPFCVHIHMHIDMPIHIEIDNTSRSCLLTICTVPCSFFLRDCQSLPTQVHTFQDNMSAVEINT